MANSKYEYVKQFEQNIALLPHTFIVIRIDGKGFHKFTQHYKFQKPNDKNALLLMNCAARLVMNSFADIWLAYGQSDEFSFVLSRDSNLYNRRSDKISSVICSSFTSAYMHFFKSYMGYDLEIPFLPVFDSRCICYPDLPTLRDYLAWRQVDCHINNLYNTCFWSLVHSGVSNNEAEKQLSPTNSSQKNELLFSQFNINYNDIDELFKKGSVLVKVIGVSYDDSNHISVSQEQAAEKMSKKQRKKLKSVNQLQTDKEKQDWEIKNLHVCIIKDNFWKEWEQSFKDVI